MSVSLRMTDDQMSHFLEVLINTAGANLATFGLVAGDITALTGVKTDLDAKLAAEAIARDAAKSATQATKNSRSSADDAARNIAKKIDATPNVPTDLLKAAGLTVRDSKPSPVQAMVPTNLAVYGFDDGDNKLKWDKNSNKSGTTYVIEARVGDTGSFAWIANSTKPKFTHSGQTPGQKIAYRVKAQRASGDSNYSNTATVYDQALPQAA